MPTATPISSFPQRLKHRLARRFSRRWLHCLMNAFPLSAPGPLAEPWRRLLAAAFDTLLLFAVVVALTLIHLTSVPSRTVVTAEVQDVWEHAMAIVIPTFCWLYVLVGWALGATVGMRVFGIRIVRADGQSAAVPGVWIASKRIVGFLLSNLAVKGGLFPIMTHPRRQGWHDRLAGTVVVKRTHLHETLPALPQKTNTPIAWATPPDFSILKRGWIWPLLAYTILACVFTYPLVTQISTHLAGNIDDNSIFVWAYWYVSFALRHHLPLLSTNLLYYPLHSSLVYSTMEVGS